VHTSQYHLSWKKRVFDVCLSGLGLIFLSPVLLIIAIGVLLTSGSPIFFRQKRAGFQKNMFLMYKFRTMKLNADAMKKNLIKKNEAPWPMFKIENDPRFTPIGKFLSNTGLDELPQLFHVFLGQMSLIGPRPLPIDEALKLPQSWDFRYKVRPGILSRWAIAPDRYTSLEYWRNLEKKDVIEGTFIEDSRLILHAVAFLIRKNLRFFLQNQKIDWGNKPNQSLFAGAFFSFLFLLSFFLTETNYLIFIFLFITTFYSAYLLYFCTSKKNQISNIDTYIIFFTSFFFLSILVVNYFFHPSYSTIYHYLQLSIGAMTFSFFAIKNLFSSKTLKYFLLITTFPSISIFGLNVFLLLFSNFTASFPALTLLTSVYGHNHIYIYYLYCISITLSFFKKKFNFFYIITLISTLGVIISFSRVGTILLILILIFHYAHYRSKNILYFIVPAVVGSIFVLGSSLFFSYSHTSCQFSLFQKQLCKNYLTEIRPTYWKQAIQGIQEHPLIGNGSGSFEYKSLQYRKNSSDYSAFPHNDYLQLLFEFGILGIFPLIFFSLFIIYSLCLFKKSDFFTQSMFFLTYIYFFDSAMNFNWNISVLLVIECMIFGISISHLPRHYLSRTKIQRIFFVFSWYCLLLPTLFFCIRYAVAELFFIDNPSSYFTLYPYSKINVEKGLINRSFSTNDLRSILLKYQNSKSIYQTVSSQLNIDKYDMYSHLLSLDPLDIEIRCELISYAVRMNQYQIVEEQLKIFFDLTQVKGLKSTSPCSVDLTQKVMFYVNDLSTSNAQSALLITKLVYTAEPWTVNKVKSIFLLSPEKFPRKLVIEILQIKNLDPLWSYEKTLSPWLIDQVIYSMSKPDQELFEQSSAYLLKEYPWKRWDLWHEAKNVYLDKPNEQSLKYLGRFPQIFKQTLLQIDKSYPQDPQYVIDIETWENEVGFLTEPKKKG